MKTRQLTCYSILTVHDTYDNTVFGDTFNIYINKNLIKTSLVTKGTEGNQYITGIVLVSFSYDLEYAGTKQRKH
jgi:hypothetical protein